MRQVECADAVVTLGDSIVLIERFTVPCGLALPGGKCEPGESFEGAIARECKEELGLDVQVHKKLGVFDAPGRDPRGNYVSHVFHCDARGTPKSEPGKTSVVVVHKSDVHKLASRFVLDHYAMLSVFLKSQ